MENSLKETVDFSLRRDETARHNILWFEEALRTLPDAVDATSELVPLRHTFADGLYVRELRLPKHFVFTGKLHKYAYPLFVLQG